jgi:hypothetical protein
VNAGKESDPARPGGHSPATGTGTLSQYLEASSDRSASKEDEGELVEPQPAHEVGKVLSDHLSKRGVANNRLAGKGEGEEEGVILLPPYECEVDPDGDTIRVTIRGSSGDPSDSVWDGDTSWTTTCDRVVASRYRGNALIFYRDSGGQQPERDVLVPIQESRVEMLKSVPPGGSLQKDDFLHHQNNLKEDGTPQSDAPRRWRELRSEFGFDVWEEGGRYYRSNTIPPVEKPNRRPDMAYLKRKYWDELYERHDGKCNICGREVRYDADDDGLYGLLDHRVPVPYGGADDKENLQVACQECNNIKKKRYERDPEQYLSENLALAYPEKFERFLVQLSSEEGEMLRALSQEREVPVRTFAGNLLGAAARMLADENGR